MCSLGEAGGGGRSRGAGGLVPCRGSLLREDAKRALLPSAMSIFAMPSVGRRYLSIFRAVHGGPPDRKRLRLRLRGRGGNGSKDTCGGCRRVKTGGMRTCIECKDRGGGCKHLPSLDHAPAGPGTCRRSDREGHRRGHESLREDCGGLDGDRQALCAARDAIGRPAPLLPHPCMPPPPP